MEEEVKTPTADEQPETPAENAEGAETPAEETPTEDAEEPAADAE